MLDLVPSALHGKQHVGAGVAIGHRENVEGVDGELMIPQPGQAGLDQPLQALTVNLKQFFSSAVRFE
jgi:hypothetical protein